MKKDTDIKHALVLAAGRGLRMRPLTDEIPKAMAPLGESTLISEGIKRLKKEINQVHITIGYKGSMLASHVIEKDVSSVINTEGKGNSWWLYNSLVSLIDEPIFVLTCDNVIKINFTNELLIIKPKKNVNYQVEQQDYLVYFFLWIFLLLLQ